MQEKEQSKVISQKENDNLKNIINQKIMIINLT